MYKPPIIIEDIYSIEKCNNNPDNLYIFGDNTKKIGTGGQACIRYCNNSFGISTKLSISEYFTDDQFIQNSEIISQEILTIQVSIQSGIYNNLVFPTSGIGWGRANMQKKCPKTALFLCLKLLHVFNYNNIQDLINQITF